MKKISIFIIGMLFVGCSVGPVGHRTASLESSDEGGVKYSDRYLGALMPTVSPRELADAELTQAMAQQIRKGETANVVGEFIGCLVNQDRTRYLTLYHPTISKKIIVKPGEERIFFSTIVPEHLNIRWHGKDRLDQVRVDKKKGVYNGIEIDYGIRVWCQR